MPAIRPRVTLLAASVAGVLLTGGLVSTTLAQAPPTPVAKKSAVAPVLTGDKLHGPKGFQVDLIYTVPRDTQGSWVNLAVDPKGRLITSDQYGKLYRVTPPPLDAAADEAPKVEPIVVDIGEAQGLLWAFDSLYVVVNKGVEVRQRALPRHRHQRRRRPRQGRTPPQARTAAGEHGPHAVVLAPDGKSLFVRRRQRHGGCPELAGSMVPRTWGEDNLLPRTARTAERVHARREGAGRLHLPRQPRRQGLDVLQSMGYRNAFDIAFNRDR